MRNKIKITIAACLGCILMLGGTITVFAAGALSIAVSSGSVKTGDTVTVTVYANGANNEDVTADMNITYDTSKLEYVSSSASGATGGGGTVKATGSTVDIKFKAVGSGDAYVKAEGAAVTAAGAHITVSGAAAGTDTAADTAATTKSGDNSLSSLKISQGTLSPAFKGSVTEYTASVGSDVNEITVTPVTSNSKATVESITGNTNLAAGTNTIKILVKAENGTEATYTIKVTKSETAAASTTAATADTVESSDTTAQTQTTDDAAANGDASANSSGNAIVIDGVNYSISEAFTEDDIPEGFSRADFEYKGEPYQGVIFDSGHLGMYYLVNDAGEGKFFVYDADRDGFYPYVRLSSGEHFIILMSVPNGAIPPDNYEVTTLAISDSITISAYQYAGNEDAEIVKIQTEDGEEDISGGRSDFYIFYGMDETGVAGWYQYDSKQGTYQRLNEEATATEDNTENYDALLESYNSLSDRYKSTKASDRKIIAVLIFVSVVLVILVINLLLKIRDLNSDEEEDEDEEEAAIPVRKAKREVKHTREVKQTRRVKPEKPKKEVRRTAAERTENFYEDDDEDIMDEFEENPSVLGNRNRKKEVLKKELKKPEIHPKDDDDDIEFLDLNDL